jgi:hypothetical protein
MQSVILRVWRFRGVLKSYESFKKMVASDAKMTFFIAS